MVEMEISKILDREGFSKLSIEERKLYLKCLMDVRQFMQDEQDKVWEEMRVLSEEGNNEESLKNTYKWSAIFNLVRVFNKQIDELYKSPYLI